MKPLVSIAIITYNQVQFIHETLQSALEQDYENLEIVVADDGSTDGTAEVILEYARKYPGKIIPLVGGENVGITRNSNRALRACNGKYIAFQGGDDILLPGKISAQVEWMEQDSKRVLCGHDVEAFDNLTGKTVYLWSQRFSLSEGRGAYKIVEKGVPFCATSVMVRASSIPKYGFDERLPIVSDWKLWIDCLANEGVYGYVEGVYARYRLHSNNITKRRVSIMNDNFVTLALVESTYPHLLKSCTKGRSRLYYAQGVEYLLNGERYIARQYLLNAINLRKFSNPKVYIWCLLTFVPNGVLEKAKKLIFYRKK